MMQWWADYLDRLRTPAAGAVREGCCINPKTRKTAGDLDFSVAPTYVVIHCSPPENLAEQFFSKVSARRVAWQPNSRRSYLSAEAEMMRRIATLPRLGSRVRIPSPAPDFLKKIR